MNTKTLEARLEKLEAAGGGNIPLTNITVRFVTPRANPGELRGFHFNSIEDGCYVAREPNETEQALRERAKARLPAANWVTVMYEDREWIPDPAQALGLERPRPSQRIEDQPADTRPKGNRMLPGNGSSLEILKS